MKFPYKIVRPFLFNLNPECAHAVSIWALKHKMIKVPYLNDPILSQTLCGIQFLNPLGMAAGYDKNAEAVDGILKLGFSFVEIGTVTPKPQAGNPKPRLFRLKDDKALINRMGFNNEGHLKIRSRLLQRQNLGIVGVNLGANKNSNNRIQDYVTGIAVFYNVARYFTINISSPNTPGLRELQTKSELSKLLRAVIERRDLEYKKTHLYRPLFLKIAPDLCEVELDVIAEEVEKNLIDGVIVTNTTIIRKDLNSFHKNEMGGLSGRPLFDKSTIILAKLRLRLGKNIVLVASGGIDHLDRAVGKIRAGADLLQLYTGLIYEGPMLPYKILSKLAKFLRQEGASQIREIRDIDTELCAAKKITSI